MPHHKCISTPVPYKGYEVEVPAGSYAVSYRTQDGYKTKYYNFKQPSVINLKELFFRQV
jgi:hypothetical protein